jgi:GTP cyclohydrolase I
MSAGVERWGHEGQAQSITADLDKALVDPTPEHLKHATDRFWQAISRTPVREHENGSLLVGDILITPEDAVRILIRAMGEDPREERLRNVPARVVRSLRRVKRGAAVDAGECITGQMERCCGEVGR